MVPASFPESTAVLSRPEGMTAEQCDPLCVCQGMTPGGVPVVISCWKLTPDEKVEVDRTGRIWLMVCGMTMPPVILSGVRPFDREPTESKPSESKQFASIDDAAAQTLRTALDELPVAEKIKAQAAIEEVRDVIELYGDFGKFAVAYVGAHLAAES